MKGIPVREAEIGWNYLTRQAALVVLRVDDRGCIRFANSYAEKLTGLSLVTGSLNDLLALPSDESDRQRWLTPSVEPRIMNIRTASGLPQTLYVTTVPLGSELLLFGQVDPEEQERLHREVLELNHELTALGRELARTNAELSRLNALKNQFLGMAAHDLRKPTGLILNLSELLLDDATGESGPNARSSLQKIIALATAMARLIDDFLDVSMIEAGRLTLDIQSVAQQELVATALTMMRAPAEKRGIRLQTCLDEAAARLRVDGPKLGQVLANLLSNAIEVSPDGGSVTVGSRADDEGVRFWVVDEGAGLDNEQQQRLFQAFSGSAGLKQSGERSIGLGLVIVRKIVEAHGGSVFVESQPGQGSCFGFVLPARCRSGKVDERGNRKYE